MSGPVDLRPTAGGGHARAFLERAALRAGGGPGALVAVDRDGHEHPLDGVARLVLQHDEVVGPRQLHGAYDLVLVLDGEGRALASAPSDAFAPDQVAAFCRAAGLPLERTRRTAADRPLPPKAPGYVDLAATPRTRALAAAPLAVGIVVGVVTPVPLLLAAVAGLVLSLVLLAALS